MIGTFKHKGLKAYFQKQDLSGIVPSHAARLDECLKILADAQSPRDLARDAHPMTRGSAMEGLWAMRVSAQWRLIFRMAGHGTCSDIGYRNYH